MFGTTAASTQAAVALFSSDRDSQSVGAVGKSAFQNPLRGYAGDVSTHNWEQIFRTTQLLFRCLYILLGFQELNVLRVVRASSCRSFLEI